MRLMLSLTVLLSMSFPVLAGEWPQFHGPNAAGIAAEKGLATSWPEGGPKELWTLSLHQGFGGSAVKDGKVYVMDRVGTEKDVIYCLDLATGKEQWNYPYEAKGKVDYPGPRATPAVDDKYVYTVGPMGQLTCLTLEGKLAWTKNLLSEYGAQRAYWGVAGSPVLHGNMVIVAPQGAKAGVVALDRASGKLLWASDPIGPMAYCTPLIATIDKVPQVAIATGQGTFGIDMKGKTLWHYTGWTCGIPIASPTVTSAGIFMTSVPGGPYKSDCALFQPELQGGKWTVKPVFKNKSLLSQLHNAVFYEGHIYGCSGANGKGLVCLDLKGNVVWEHNPADDRFDNGSGVLVADGMLYVMNGASGTLYLVKASPEKYQELAKAKVLKPGQVWAPMAIAEGKLLCRDQGQLKCLDITAAK